MGQLQREVHLKEPRWKEACRRDRAREVKDRVTEVKGKPGREGEGEQKTGRGEKSFVNKCLKQVTVFEIIFFSLRKLMTIFEHTATFT